jgi:2-oxoisovalerate dehydrogenase E2 component (dihydrolipoyl transacylase)
MQEEGAAVQEAAVVAPAKAEKTEREASGIFPSGTSAGGWYTEEEDELDLYINTPEPEKKERKPNRYSPAVRRLAEEHHLELDKLNLRGSGIGGRITRDDVMNYLQIQRAVPNPNEPVRTRVTANMTGTAKAPETEEQIQKAFEPPVEALAVQDTSQESVPVKNTPEPVTTQNGAVTPLTPMRRTIAEHMTRSKQTIPHAWTMVEVDMSRIVKKRAQMKEEFRQREGLDLTYLPFFIMAVTEGLKQFPQMNAAWTQDGIVQKREFNLGVAIDVQDGLVVPVLPHADELNLVGLARRLNDLITRARNRKLTVADMQGGTFTVNNPGAFGSVQSYPIINQGQAGIITMEAIVKRPVVVGDSDGNDTIAIRSMMNICLSFDHRVVDGATGGRFLQAVKKGLEKL